MIYLLTNVAKTQDVPLDGTIFLGNTGQKDKAFFMKKKKNKKNNSCLVTLAFQKTKESPFNNLKKTKYDIPPNKCC